MASSHIIPLLHTITIVISFGKRKGFFLGAAPPTPPLGKERSFSWGLRPQPPLGKERVFSWGLRPQTPALLQYVLAFSW